MKLKSRLSVWTLILCCLASMLYADVPSPRLRNPQVPYLLDPMHFQTVAMKVFPIEASGMMPDAWSDAHWNPAFLLHQTQKSLYLDFSDPSGSSGLSSVSRYTPQYFTSDLLVNPRWYSATSVSGMRNTPLYQFAAIFPAGGRLVIGLVNRSIFDYGSFLSENVPVWNDSWADYESRAGNKDGSAVLKRMESDENQQTVLGNQAELILGYRLSEKIDLGGRIGHMVYSREGNLYNSQWSNDPHTSFADLKDESLDLSGHHIEAGLGLMWRPDDGSSLGLYGGMITGSGSETDASKDTSNTWWEKDTDTKYYEKRKYNLESSDGYELDGTRPSFTLTYERRFSEKFLFRTFLEGTWLKRDLEGTRASSDTSWGDRTYDAWDYSTTHFQRLESHGSRGDALSGTGKTSSSNWSWFASLAYAPDRDWSFFGGIRIQRWSLKENLDESTSVKSHSWNRYSLYDPKTLRNMQRHVFDYAWEREASGWSLFLPVGLKARVASGFFVILGTDLALTLRDERSSGERLYQEKIVRAWENEQNRVNDEEFDRLERYESDPARVLTRVLGNRVGLVYEHASGVSCTIKFADNIAQSGSWAIGLEWIH